ncbi:MAG: Aspartate aminotransferase [Candidatus Methanofastidiosum methylothiophilum]|uniref:Aspartate aminotransferase n=1 Tax=Candidatus Methanofastidiosum methylothiophilum TaxID=1705564 RepID=A0A150J2G9_9EURY|nr:MAG: Aspartate aminotransferase [Candidatus Methanofastidiosum methylthiophilus]KYC48535.1 MAG: Aspartate aminotransferase [Candidatus Methanofastidiosum methylthiophilus]KYC51295.1 MAG: Aspartate aminotransferase [Candidatus Methanofastidiosum methylthiophilus]
MKIRELELERYLAKYEFLAPYIFCTSDSESFEINQLLEMDVEYSEKLKKLKLSYVDPQGSEYLREEISSLYSNVSSEEIVILSGAAEGIFVIMNALLEKGDHVIVQWPCYQPLYEIPAAIGCQVTKWEMEENSKWELDLDFFRDNIKNNTKMVIINNPHNPTGYLFSTEFVTQLVNIAKEKNIWIFSDEVYRFSEYDEKNRTSAISDIYDKGISLGAMSKVFGLGGLRIGWASIKDKEVMRKVISFKDYTTICCSSTSEMISALAIRNRNQIIKRNMHIIKANLDLLDDFFKKYNHLLEWVRPKATAIGFPKIKFDMDIKDFSNDLLEKKGVLILPGYVFGDYNKNFRIGFGKLNTKEVLKKFEEYISENLIK